MTAGTVAGIAVVEVRERVGGTAVGTTGTMLVVDEITPEGKEEVMDTTDAPPAVFPLHPSIVRMWRPTVAAVVIEGPWL